MKKNLFRGALSAFLLGTCVLSASVPCLAEGSYSAPGQINNGAGGQVGNIGSDGTMYNGGGGQIGKIGSDGTIYNGGGGQVGNIGSDGTIYNGGGGQIGKIGSDGTLYNGGGGEVGKIGSDGTVYNGGGGVIGHVPAGTVSALTHNGTPSLAQQEAEIRQMQQPAPARQDQPSCVIGCSASPPTPFKRKINIRTLDGSLVGWADEGGIKLAANALPALHLNSPIGDKYSGLDIGLMFPDYGISRVVTRILSDAEIDRIQKSESKMATNIIGDNAIPMGYVDQFGNITDLQGKKIGYEEIGDTVYDVNAVEKTAIYQNNQKFSYPNILGIFEPNGDVRDIHNRLVGRLDDSQRDDPIYRTGQPEALKLIKKYEKQHPWHSAVHKMTKSPLK